MDIRRRALRILAGKGPSLSSWFSGGMLVAMTAQVHDQVEWRHRKYLLVGVDGDRLFDPADHGLHDLRPTTTANWRGWVAHYAIVDDRLLLAELVDVGLFVLPGETVPAFDGVEATYEGRGPLSYTGLDLPLDFTGKLLIAHGFIDSLYRHMGFHPAWKFEESWELEIDKGSLTDARDLSDEMRTRRKDIERGVDRDPDDVSQPGWIQRTFRLDFWRSKGR